MEYLAGQTAMKTLMEDIAQNRVRQSYIFDGAHNIGKLTAAKRFAAALHCKGGQRPCGECDACKKHAAATHPDVLILGEDDDTLPSVSEVRDITAELYIRPLLADKKVCIIDNAGKLTVQSQNALLKTLEEPPASSVIILLADSARNLLATIRSRCVHVEFEPFEQKTLADYIERNVPEYASEAEFLARFSGGVIGKALALCGEGEFFKLRKELYKALLALTGSESSVFAAAEVFGINGKRPGEGYIDTCFDLALSFFGDAARAKLSQTLVNEDMREEIAQFASCVTMRAVLNTVDILSKTRAGLNISMKYDLWTVDMFTKCWEEIHD
ncbi:MAG: DNA polymerase III subunit delta' C-terminal domain-containing protein [Clostridia bacterium]|nr:DNA polymerase III subunit delta' C-terminal domain-containing protein [Clostridia bacterium]